jgi:hypothetical protein
MRGNLMAGQWRTIQFFVSEDGVFEVEGDLDNAKAIRCTCPRFASRSRCPHAKWVRENIKHNNNNFNIKLPNHVSDEEIAGVVEDKDLFRDLVLKYSQIEFID